MKQLIYNSIKGYNLLSRLQKSNQEGQSQAHAEDEFVLYETWTLLGHAAAHLKEIDHALVNNSRWNIFIYLLVLFNFCM
jgi:hypothetical protein